MAQTLTERVTTLERLIDILITRLNNLDKDVDTHTRVFSKTTRQFADLERDFERESALLRREVDELRAWREEWKRGNEEFGRRLWMIVPPIIAAVVSSALTGLITYLIRR